MSQFCLRWNNHQPNFISVFTNLLNTESLVDVTLAAEGKHLQAHKVVLSACSVYFQTLFTNNPSRHPIVIIKDVSYWDLRVLVDFMYYGEVNVTEEQLPRILDTARMLKIKGLTEMPDSTKHSSPQTNNQQDNTTERTNSTTSPADRSPAARRKKHKQSEEEAQAMQPDVDKETQCVDVASSESAVTNIPQNNMYRQDLYNLQQRTQEREETSMRAQQMTFPAHNDSIQQYTQHEQNAALIAPNISGIQWVNPSGFTSAPPEPIAERHDAGGGAYQISERQATPTDSHLNSYDVCNDTPRGLNDTQVPRQMDSANKRRRTANPQAAENFQRAIEAVRFGGIGFCKAARIFGVNTRTLWLEYKKKGYPIHRPSIRERIKREPVEPEPPGELPQLPEPAPGPEPPAHQLPAGYVLNQSCFQYLQDNSLQGF